MLVMTPKGLYCPAGNFYIDPKSAVEHAVITHAHADHARRGSQNYYCVRSGMDLLRARIGKNISVQGIEYRQDFFFNEVQVSFHPAGHILGSAQVRMFFAGQVWVASGDYKRELDPTCEAFEVVPCDVFVTEATFGTPGYTWNKGANLGKEIFDWWTENAKRKLNSVLFAYSLGKAQRILGVLEPLIHGEIENERKREIYCHPATSILNDCYRRQGVKLAPTKCLSQVDLNTRLEGELILTPSSFLKSPQAQILGDKYETAFASGWMSKNMRGFDRGFVMSDHADWNDLLQTIQETRAKKIYVQHRGSGSLVRHLRSLGLSAHSEAELVPKVPDQMAWF